jgi:hypothetical protein
MGVLQAERAGAGHGIPHLAAHGLAEPRVEQPVEEPVPDPAQQAGAVALTAASPVLRLGVLNGRGRGCTEQAGFAPCSCFVGRGGPDLFKNPRNHQQEGGPERIQVLQETRRARRVSQGGTGCQADHLHCAGQHMGERQEHQRPGLLLQQQFGKEGNNVLGYQGEIAVRDFAPLGLARGSGGVDQGSDVVQHRLAPVPFQLGIGDAHPCSGKAREIGGIAVGIHPDDVDQPVPQQGRAGQDSRYKPRLAAVLREHAPDAGVVEDPLHLARRGRFVDGNGHAAGKPDGEIHQGPLIGGGRHYGHRVTGLEPARNEALGKGADVLQEFLRRGRPPSRWAPCAGTGHGQGWPPAVPVTGP